MFTRGHISLTFAFKGQNVILGLYKCNYSLTVKQELGAAAGQKQGAGQIKQDGGPDSARGPCVCHLCPTDSSVACAQLFIHTLTETFLKSWKN